MQGTNMASHVRGNMSQDSYGVYSANVAELQ